MNIPLKMNRDFEKAMTTLNERYGEDFEYLNGFHETQLNFSDFIDGFIDKNVADVTIDANANASNKDIRSLLNEKGKSHDKLFAFNKIFYEMKKRYNLKTAREWLETEYNGGFYLHDASTSTYLPYCYAYDLTRLATEGLFFLKNYNNQAPKHLTTFMDDVIEYISYMSNRSSGAVGIPNVLKFGYISYTDEGIAFASKIFEVLNEVKDNFTDAYSFNIESVPAERAAVILCQKDNVLYDHNDKFIYSNQWIPLSAKCTIQEKLRLSSILDEKCSGGSIAHINLESNFPNTETAWKMLNKIAQAGVIYFAFNTRINECKNHHGFVGTDHCPVCGEPVFDTYQRIVGYLVPSRAYSKDRFREFNTRQWYSYAEAMSE